MKKITLLALLIPNLVLASGYEVINVNPRDLALTSSAVAAQSEAPAAFFNPAALSKVEGLSLSLGAAVLSISTDWKAPSGSTTVQGSASTKFEPVTPLAIYAAYGTKIGNRGVGVGFGLGNPAGGNVFWNDDWQGRGRIITVQRRIFGLYFSGGFEAIPNWLRLGGGLVYYIGSEYMKQGIEPVPGAFAELSTRGRGFSFDASAEATPIPGVPLTLAVDYKHQSTFDLKGDARFTVPPALAGAVSDQGATHRMTFPNLLAAGLAYRFTDTWQGTLQYSYARWRVYQDDTFVGDEGLTIVVPRHYRDGHIIRGGLEWKTSPVLTLRAGAMRDFSGLSRAAYSPTLPDSSIWAGAIGAGWEFHKNMTVEAAFFYGVRDQVTSTNNRTATNPTGTFPGVYDTNVWIYSMAFTWKIPELGR